MNGPTTEELAEIKALRPEVAHQQRTIETLKAAAPPLSRRRPTRDRCDGPLCRGAPRAVANSDRLAEAKVAASVGSRGESYDNSMAETRNGTFTAELVKLHGP